MIALIVVALGAVIAAVGTGMIAARSSRRPRMYLIAWAVALFGLAIGLGATTLGYLAGYSALIFRAMEIGAQLITPLALCVALVEIAGQSLPARFAIRLLVSAIAVIALVILGTDPINPSVTFTSNWPDPASYYQIAPLTVLGFLALFTAVTGGVSLVITALRSSREISREEARPTIVLAVATLAIALPGLSLPLPAKDVFAASCTVAAGLLWYAARIAGDRDLGQAPTAESASSHADRDWDEFDEYGRRDPDDYSGEDVSLRGRRPDTDSRPYEGAGSDYRYPGLAELLDGPVEPVDEARRHGEVGSDDDAVSYGQTERYEETGQFDGPDQYNTGDWYGGPGDYREAGRFAGSPSAQLFGQITIYTLVEGRTEDFDRLTEWVMAQVRSKEPDTLVYIVHAVPTAPQQRILYEVYRDRGAHDDHLRRSYVLTYEAEQRPFVLATNVIELGLQQAKVSPLPSFSAISDILSESGIDLTGVTRSSRSDGQSPARGHDVGQQPHHPGHQLPQDGWAGIRGEDTRYR